MIQYSMGKIDKIFGIKKHDVISIVGAGGKTSLMYFLGSHFEKTLMTTTTKLFVPEDKNLIVGDIPSSFDGSFVIAKKQVEDKLHGFTCGELKSFYSEFDYTFIEADGARMKSLKAWNDSEPVICDFSNKTIGVLDIQTFGEPTDEIVFRLDEYSKITEVSDLITLDNLRDIVLHKNGLFKRSKYKVLFINKVELLEHADRAFELIKLLLEDPRFNLDRIVIGSVHKENFEVVYKHRGLFVLASGMSKRMGEDKLSVNYKGIPLIEHILKKLSYYPEDLYIVSSDDRFKDLAKKYNAEIIVNNLYEHGQSESIKKSLEEDYKLYTFFLGDMPNITEDTISKIMNTYSELVACGNKEMFSAPATLSIRYRDELNMLTGDQGAKKVLKKYFDDIEFINVDEDELFDIDTKEDLEGTK